MICLNSKGRIIANRNPSRSPHRTTATTGVSNAAKYLHFSVVALGPRSNRGSGRRILGIHKASELIRSGHGRMFTLRLLAPDDLKGLVLQLLEDVDRAEGRERPSRRDCAAKGLAAEAQTERHGEGHRAGAHGHARRAAGVARSRLVIDEERVLKAVVPPGSRFKGSRPTWRS